MTNNNFETTRILTKEENEREEASMEKQSVQEFLSTYGSDILKTKRDAIYFIGNLLNGTIIVDVRTGVIHGAICELQQDGFGYGYELVYMLNLLGVKEVPIDVLTKMKLQRINKKGVVTEGNNDKELTITELLQEIYRSMGLQIKKEELLIAAKGVLAGLLKGNMQVREGKRVYISEELGKGDKNNVVYIKWLEGILFEKGSLDVYEDFIDDWINYTEEDIKALVDKIVNIIKE